MAEGYDGEISLVPQFLRGYRAWFVSRFRDSEYQLRAITHQRYAWVPGQQIAECARSVDHGMSPEPSCQCGFYASYTSNQYLDHVSSRDPYYRWLSRDGHVVLHGSIRATGRVVMGTTGFRAEKVEPEAFCLAPTGGNISVLPGAAAVLAEKILEPFDVPLFSCMEDLEEAFPASDVSELAPKAEPGGIETPSHTQSLYSRLQAWPSVHGINCQPNLCAECKAEKELKIRELELGLLTKQRIMFRYDDNDWPSLQGPWRNATGK